MVKQKKSLVLKSAPLKALTEQQLDMVTGGNVPKQPDNTKWVPRTLDGGS